MDPFSYISVILSIVLGLAIAQVLLGFRGLILTRAKVKLYAPTIISGILCAPHSDSGMVGRISLCESKPTGLFWRCS